MMITGVSPWVPEGRTNTGLTSDPPDVLHADRVMIDAQFVTSVLDVGGQLKFPLFNGRNLGSKPIQEPSCRLLALEDQRNERRGECTSTSVLALRSS